MVHTAHSPQAIRWIKPLITCQSLCQSPPPSPHLLFLKQRSLCFSSPRSLIAVVFQFHGRFFPIINLLNMPIIYSRLPVRILLDFNKKIVSPFCLIIGSVECADVGLVSAGPVSCVRRSLVVHGGRVCLCDWGGKTVHSLRGGSPKINPQKRPNKESTFLQSEAQTAEKRSKRGSLVFELGAGALSLVPNCHIWTCQVKGITYWSWNHYLEK